MCRAAAAAVPVSGGGGGPVGAHAAPYAPRQPEPPSAAASCSCKRPSRRRGRKGNAAAGIARAFELAPSLLRSGSFTASAACCLALRIDPRLVGRRRCRRVDGCCASRCDASGPPEPGAPFRKAKVATHASAGARAEVSKLKPQAAVHTHAALRLLADGEVAHRVGGRVDAALAKPVTKRRGSVGHRSRLDACALLAPPVALRPRHYRRVGRRDVSAVARQVGRREGLTAVRDAAWPDCACWMDPARESPPGGSIGHGMGLDPGLGTAPRGAGRGSCRGLWAERAAFVVTGRGISNGSPFSWAARIRTGLWKKMASIDAAAIGWTGVVGDGAHLGRGGCARPPRTISRGGSAAPLGRDRSGGPAPGAGAAAACAGALLRAARSWRARRSWGRGCPCRRRRRPPCRLS